ncbi:hypothetical protein Tco_1155518 [Tanacetum coccineum]
MPAIGGFTQGDVYAATGNYNAGVLDALDQMPKYAKMLKDLLTNKEKLLELANTPLNENCSSILLNKLPKKLGDPGKFLITENHFTDDAVLSRLNPQTEKVDSNSRDESNLQCWIALRNILISTERESINQIDIIEHYMRGPFSRSVKWDLVEMEMNDNFPHESLNMIALNDDNKPSWFADIANYLMESYVLSNNKRFRMGKEAYGFSKAVTMYHRRTLWPYKLAPVKKVFDSGLETPRAIISNRDDALWAFRTAFKTRIGCTPYKLMYDKACHLPIELEHKAYWALKWTNFDLKTAGDHRKIEDFLGGKFQGPFTITEVFPYGTVELSQPNGPNFKVNGHRIKHYHRGDIPALDVPDLRLSPMNN